MTQLLRKFEPIALPALPDRPLFSVLIRNYNYARYVGMALQSVLDQTYENWEAIVCDDGSTDNSREVVQKYANENSRIKLVAQQNGGIVSAANAAYAESTGQVICFLDADDMFRPSKLEQVLTTFRNNPRSGLCAHRIQPISREGRPLGAPYPPDLDRGWTGPEKLRRGSLHSLPPNSGLSFRREVASELFPISAELKWLDDFYLTAAQFFTEISLAPGCLTDYRVHGENRSSTSKATPRPFWLRSDAESKARYAGNLERVLLLQRDFLAGFYGPAIADTLRVQDNQSYWDTLLSLRALRGRRAGAIRPYSLKEMISHVDQPRHQWIWRGIMLLPDPLAKRVFCFWRTPSTLKTFIKMAVFHSRHPA
jgi:glycosyltransferase involved in cell wall biosynthesis